MKLFALYLPQFHTIPENDEWWGEGFTEWTNVKRARPLFSGHIQPKHPLGNEYYNLLDKETVAKQTELMKHYGIDGMIYYHYYFNGNKLLERPAENLLNWKDIDQKFFFCWANHSWKRTWNGTSEILMEQAYGKQEDWRKHFDYLLPFFLDARYEKKDNRPVFMIYDASFEVKKEMMYYFDKWCKESGFEGIYCIEECFDIRKNKFSVFKSNISDVTEKIYLTEPLIGKLETYYSNILIRIYRKIISELNKSGYIKKVEVFDGNKIYKSMIKRRKQFQETIPGVFFEWDNTPRHGFRGFVITPPRKDIFFEYMNEIKESEYVIINAWNEWAEGMVLEPSEELKDKYLNWILQWKDEEVMDETCD